MSLADHLRELRRRVLVAALGIFAGGVVGWLNYEWLMALLMGPLERVQDERGEALVNLNFGGGITQPFSIQLKVAIFVGIVVSSPVWISQIWGFIVPGLRKKEKLTALAFIAAAVPLFLGGCALAGWALPRTVAVLLSFTPDFAVNLQDASVYLSFVTGFIVAFGLAFLLPVFLVALNVAHVLSAQAMLRGWRVAVMLIFVFAALVTPDPSAWTMLALAVPMVALYYLAVGVATLIDRRRAKNRPEWADTADDEASAL